MGAWREEGGKRKREGGTRESRGGGRGRYLDCFAGEQGELGVVLEAAGLMPGLQHEDLAARLDDHRVAARQRAEGLR